LSWVTEDEVVRAQRLFDAVSPQYVVHWAAEQLATGRDDDELVWLASTEDDSAFAIDEHLDRLLADQDIATPDEERATLVVAYAVSIEILNGSIGPYTGAKRILAWTSSTGPPDQNITAFIALVDFWEDGDGTHEKVEAQILDEARWLVNHVRGT
jgi:hypothetical protein